MVNYKFGLVWAIHPRSEIYLGHSWFGLVVGWSALCVYSLFCYSSGASAHIGITKHGLCAAQRGAIWSYRGKRIGQPEKHAAHGLPTGLWEMTICVVQQKKASQRLTARKRGRFSCITEVVVVG